MEKTNVSEAKGTQTFYPVVRYSVLKRVDDVYFYGRFKHFLAIGTQSGRIFLYS